MLFTADRLHFFRPSTGKYREQVVACLRSLYTRFYSSLAEYSRVVDRDLVIEARSTAPIERDQPRGCSICQSFSAPCGLSTSDRCREKSCSRRESFLAVARHIDTEAGSDELRLQVVAHRGFIFDHQNTHGVEECAFWCWFSSRVL